jgi:hypothetical protein
MRGKELDRTERSGGVTSTRPAGQFAGRLSIIIPTLNEATGIAATLEALGPLRLAQHYDAEPG